MARRPKGEGYLSWDDKRQKWRATVPIPGGGTRTRYFGSPHQTKAAARREAEAWRKEQVAAIQAGRDLKAADKTVEIALAEMIRSQADYLRYQTIRNYRLYAKHINEHLGAMAVGRVDTPDIEQMDRAHRKELSASVCENILTLLNTLYKRLIALRIVIYNPVTAYRTITPLRARGGAPPRDPIALDPGLCKLLLKALADDPYLAPIVWMLILGLRIGELRGLRWVNVLEKEGIVKIVEQRTEEDRHTAKPIKTKDEIGEGRDLPLPKILLLITPRSADADLVFPARDGGSVDEDAIRNHLNQAIERAKIIAIRIHDLRHTAGSNILRLGCPEWYVEHFLGHEPGTMTRHYARPNPDALRPYVEQWAEMLLGTVGNLDKQTAEE